MKVPSVTLAHRSFSEVHQSNALSRLAIDTSFRGCWLVLGADGAPASSPASTAAAAEPASAPPECGDEKLVMLGGPRNGRGSSEHAPRAALRVYKE